MSQQEAEALRLRAEIFKALGHPTRLWIVERLIEGECCVTDLAAGVEGGVSAVSQHLALLRQTGIVKDARRGRQICYSLTFPCIAELCAILNGRLAKKASPLEKLRKLLPLLLVVLVSGLLFGVGVQVGAQHTLASVTEDRGDGQPRLVKRSVQITDEYRYCLPPKRCAHVEGCGCLKEQL